MGNNFNKLITNLKKRLSNFKDAICSIARFLCIIFIFFVISLVAVHRFQNFFNSIPAVNYLYYFSTIAQTLGAFLGFTGIFIVFKLEGLMSAARETQMQIHKSLEYFGAGEYEGAIERGLKIVEQHEYDMNSKNSGKAKEIAAYIKRYDATLQRRMEILRDFISPLLWSAIVIAFSICFLLFVPKNIGMASQMPVFSSLVGFCLLVVLWRVIIFIYRALRY